MVSEVSQPRRLELILRQIDTLPTLPAIATRLLQLTSSDASETREVVQLISADPPLTAKILSLCRSADRGARDGNQQVMSVERAVVLLGFNTVRNAVLSLKVFELFQQQQQDAADRRGLALQRDADEQDAPAFDRTGFWSHSLAVALAAEMIAKAHRAPDLNPDEAFVCGLLHDVGKLALDLALPKSYAKCVSLAATHQGNIATYERQLIGIDHHTAGKRLAEQWGLPLQLQDTIWLHGSPLDSLPPLPHRKLVGLIQLADTIARAQHIGYSGNHALQPDADTLTKQLGFDLDLVHAATQDLYPALEERGKALGMHELPSREQFFASIQKANAALGKLNATLDHRSRAAATQARVLQAITDFHALATPGRSVQDLLDRAAHSAATLFGPGFYALLHPLPETPDEPAAWLLCRYTPEGEPLDAKVLDQPPAAPDLRTLDTQANSSAGSMSLTGVLPWVADELMEADDLRDIEILPLASGWGTAALLLHDRPSLPTASILTPLTRTWGAAIAAASQHDGARRLGEQLAEANTALQDAQDTLLKQASMARLGEMAAGAAHEMNNPLAVISGRSQLLSMSLEAGSKNQAAAQQVFREAHRLSDLITCLHMFAEPPQADRKPVDPAALLDTIVRKVKATRRKRQAEIDIYLTLGDDLSPALLDADQVARAVTELLLNALQASPKEAISVTATSKPWGNHAEPALFISVIDDGDGMDPDTLKHALDPFFSAKPAGRQVGMGLPRVQQLAAAHHGEVRLDSTPGSGTTATLILPLAEPV
ncbi:MAG: HDOD domain-containing protein [Planctomycetota bacterium]